MKISFGAGSKRQRSDLVFGEQTASQAAPKTLLLSTSSANPGPEGPRLVIPVPADDGDHPSPMPESKRKRVEASEDPKKKALREKLFRTRQKVRGDEKVEPLLLRAARRASKRKEKEEEGQDYDAIPVDVFGEAMLRGMGASEAELEAARVGESAPQSVKERYRATRKAHPGLGSDIGEKAGGGRVKLQVGDVVEVHWGAYSGKLGIVERESGVAGLDRVEIRFLGGSLVSIPRSTCVVIAEDLEKYSTESQSLRNEQNEARKEERRKKEQERQERAKRDLELAKQQQTIPQDPPPPSIHPHPKKSSKSLSSKSVPPPSRPWLAEGLVVRFVDPEFSKGRYYKLKGKVVEVKGLQGDVVVDGKLVRNVPSNSLQTVLPKKVGAKVRILDGDDVGKVAYFLQRNKANETADILLADDPYAVIRPETIQSVLRPGAIPNLPPGTRMTTLSMDFVCALDS